MKKAIISAALVAAIGAGGYMGFSANNSSSDQLSDIMLANVEAIAEGEYIVPTVPCLQFDYCDCTYDTYDASLKPITVTIERMMRVYL